jgi:hypothetical protein
MVMNWLLKSWLGLLEKPRQHQFEQVPADVEAMVLDVLLESTSFTEFILLGQVCSGWRLWRQRTFRQWLKLQVVGQPLKEFGGSIEELAFVRNNLSGKQRVCLRVGHADYGIVLVEQSCSVTCDLRPDGSTWWYLTKESGRPARCVLHGEQPGCGCEEQSLENWRRGAYIVVRWAYSIASCKPYQVAGIGPLTEEYLWMAVARLGPSIRPGRLGVREKGMLVATVQQERFYQLVGRGFSGGRQCYCQCLDRGICSVCIVAGSATNRWIVQDRSGVVFCDYREHWFSGASDAVGWRS